MFRTTKQKGINCRVTSNSLNILKMRYQFKIGKDDGVTSEIVYAANDAGKYTWLNVFKPMLPRNSRNCKSLGHFVNTGGNGYANPVMWCAFNGHSILSKPPTGGLWTWSDNGTGGSYFTTFYWPTCP